MSLFPNTFERRGGTALHNSKSHRAVRISSSRVRRKSTLGRFEALEDRCLLAVDLVSVSPGTPPDPLVAGTNEISGDPPTSKSVMISGNGRFVVFQSKASNLVADDTNAAEDVFVRDLDLGVTTLVSTNVDGTDSGTGTTFKGASVLPSVSEDGRYVTFVSFAKDLVSGVKFERIPNVFVRDRDTDGDGVYDEPGESRTTLLSIAKDGSAAGLSGADIVGTSLEARPVISPDGEFVTFASAASDLAITQMAPDGSEIADANLAFDVVKASTDGKSLEFLSLNLDRTATPSNPFGVRSTNASVSAGNKVVAFESNGYDMVETVPASVLAWNDNIFVTSDGRAELVSVNTDGDNGGDGRSKTPIISRDGRHVAFVSRATNLDASVDDVNGGIADIYVRDLAAQTTTLVSRSAVMPGTSANGSSPFSFSARKHFWGGPSISGTGRFIAFVSNATDLLPPDADVVDGNLKPDVYVIDRDSDGDGEFDEPGDSVAVLVSINNETGAAGVGGFFGASNPSISDSGRFVAFATDNVVIPGVTGMHVYVRDLITDETFLISDGSSGSGGPPVGGTLGDASISISDFTSSVGRVAFTSIAGDFDPAVTDLGGVDVYAYTPPTDIRLSGNFATGTTTHSQAFRVLYEDANPFEVGYYRSADRSFSIDAGDELLGTTTVSDAEDLALGGTAFADTVFIDTTIGGTEGEVALPGVLGPDPLEDYFVLTVADHLDTVSEFDGDPFNEDNTSVMRGLYHVPLGPVFVHGTSAANSMSVRMVSDTVEFDYGATGFGLEGVFRYDLADVSEIHIRAHEGDDSISGSPLIEVIFGGAGDDKIDAGPGNDTIDGGVGNDTLIGGTGDDIIFDGPGDDFIDGGPGDDYIVSTPGSDDIFIDEGGFDTLDFSFADQAISINLELDEVQVVDKNANTIQLNGVWEQFLGSPFDDVVTLRPIPGFRTATGGPGLDTLIVDAGGLPFLDDGTSVSFPSSPLGDIQYFDFEHVEVTNLQLFGDTNLDGAVDFADFLQVSKNFGGFGDGIAEGDFDNDGQVSFQDFLIFADNFGRHLSDESRRPINANAVDFVLTTPAWETAEETAGNSEAETEAESDDLVL